MIRTCPPPHLGVYGFASTLASGSYYADYLGSLDRYFFKEIFAAETHAIANVMSSLAKLSDDTSSYYSVRSVLAPHCARCN